MGKSNVAAGSPKAGRSRHSTEPAVTAPPIGAWLTEARALGAVLRRRAEVALRLDTGTPTGRAIGDIEAAGIAAGIGLLAVALAQAGRLAAAQRIAEADGPAALLAALADRIVEGELR